MISSGFSDMTLTDSDMTSDSVLSDRLSDALDRIGAVLSPKTAVACMASEMLTCWMPLPFMSLTAEVPTVINVLSISVARLSMLFSWLMSLIVIFTMIVVELSSLMSPPLRV